MAVLLLCLRRRCGRSHVVPARLSIQIAVGRGRHFRRVTLPKIPDSIWHPTVAHTVRDLELDTDLLRLLGTGERRVPKQFVN